MSPNATRVPETSESSASASENASPVSPNSALSTKRAPATSTAAAWWPRTTVTPRQPKCAKSSSRRPRMGRPCTLSMAFGTAVVRPPKSVAAPAASTIAESDAPRAAAPFVEEREDLRGTRLAAVDEDRVGAGAMVGLRALDRLREAPARDERLHARDEDEVGVRLAVLARLDLAAELLDVGQRLQLGAQERVRLREELVLDGDAGHADLLELAHEPAHVVEVAVARVAVEQERDRGGFGHERDVVHHLRPGQLVVVAHAEGGRDREPAAPDSLEAGLLDDARREPAVRLHQEGDLRTRK